MSTGLIARSVDGVLHVSTDDGQKPLVENVFACPDSGRTSVSASPCRVFVPDFVTTFNAGPAVQPYSAENALESSVTSCTAPRGTVAIIVCRPHASSLFLLSSRLPSCGSALTPSAVPNTVTSVPASPTRSFTFTVAVSPERSAMFLRSSVANPSFDTATSYMPVSDNAGIVAMPCASDVTSRNAPVALFVTDTFASLTTAPDSSTTSTISVAVFGDCAISGIAINNRKRNRFTEEPPLSGLDGFRTIDVRDWSRSG